MARLLYYPLVVPPSEVMHQAVLYWDGFGSVVPQEPDLRQQLVRGELAELEARGLFTALHAEPHRFGWDLPHSMALRDELARLTQTAPSPPTAFLWADKMTYWLRDELEYRGLGTRVQDAHTHSEQLFVSEDVHLAVMSMLAREMAAAYQYDGDCAYFPYTDSAHAHNLALAYGEGPRVPAWHLEIGRLLPVPAPGTPLSDVLDFRERYADERERLMRAVHRMLGELRRDYEHRADVLAGLRRELTGAAEDYRRARRAKRFAWVSRPISAAVALVTGYAGAQVLPDFGWLLGLISGQATDAAMREVQTPRGVSPEWEDFSYLHRVGTELT